MIKLYTAEKKDKKLNDEVSIRQHKTSIFDSLMLVTSLLRLLELVGLVSAHY
jgi:hypothetical protein